MAAAESDNSWDKLSNLSEYNSWVTVSNNARESVAEYTNVTEINLWI